MAWCRQATSHYLNPCWPRSIHHMVSSGHNELNWVPDHTCHPCHPTFRRLCNLYLYDSVTLGDLLKKQQHNIILPSSQHQKQVWNTLIFFFNSSIFMWINTSKNISSQKNLSHMSKGEWVSKRASERGRHAARPAEREIVILFVTPSGQPLQFHTKNPSSYDIMVCITFLQSHPSFCSLHGESMPCLADCCKWLSPEYPDHPSKLVKLDGLPYVPWENKWSPWAHRSPMITAQSRLGEVTAQSRLGHSSVTARSQLNHGILSMITAQSQLGHS